VIDTGVAIKPDLLKETSKMLSQEIKYGKHSDNDEWRYEFDCAGRQPAAVIAKASSFAPHSMCDTPALR